MNSRLLLICGLLSISVLGSAVSHAMDDPFIDLFEELKNRRRDAIPQESKEQAKERLCPQIKELVKFAEVSKLAPVFAQSDNGLPDLMNLANFTVFKSKAHQIGKELHQHDLSTCECINYLLEQKGEKALTRVKNVFGLSDKQITDYKERVTGHEERCKQSQLSMEFVDNGLPVALQKRIEQRARDFGVSVPVEVKTPWNCLSIGSYSSKKSFLNTKVDYVLGLDIATLSNSQFAWWHHRFIDADSDHCRMVGGAAINHELMHIKNGHLQKRFDLISVMLGVPTLNKNEWDVFLERLDLGQQKAWNKFARVHESEADQIVPACYDCHSASAVLMAEIFRKHGPMYDKYEKQGDPLTDGDPHPHPRKRLLWAAAIKELREAEQKQNS